MTISLRGNACPCSLLVHSPKRIVITGGPGAGKTALLEMARKSFCDHIEILPEAASIVFGGGFWRRDSLPAKQAAQRAIFHIQRELERMIEEERRAAIVLCDRGTLDGLAYWPTDEGSFFEGLNTDRNTELARYTAVVHLRTPSAERGYNHQNPIRIETAAEAQDLDLKIAAAWSGHPNQAFVESTDEFLTKVKAALDRIRGYLPECCRSHQL